MKYVLLENPQSKIYLFDEKIVWSPKYADKGAWFISENKKNETSTVKKTHRFTIKNDMNMTIYLYLNESGQLTQEVTIEADMEYTIESFHGKVYALFNKEKSYQVTFRIGSGAFKKLEMAVAASLLQKLHGVLAAGNKTSWNILILLFDEIN